MLKKAVGDGGLPVRQWCAVDTERLKRKPTRKYQRRRGKNLDSIVMVTDSYSMNYGVSSAGGCDKEYKMRNI